MWSKVVVLFDKLVVGACLVWKKQIYIVPQLRLCQTTLSPYWGMLSCQSEKLKIDSSGGWSSAGLVT